MNNGCFHPILNSNGTYKASDGKFWYETAVVLNSVADCFKPANIGTVNGRPDRKSDKYIYSENFIDVREYAKILNPYEVELIRDDKEENGVEELNGVLYSSNKLTADELSGSSQTVFNLTKKAITVHQVLKSTDSGITWSNISFTHQSIANTVTVVASDLILVSYTSKNNPYIQTTPKPILDVEPKVIASNSHSIYKGALIGNQVAGKIQVGNGTNGYESRVLENSDTNGYSYVQGYTNTRLTFDVKKGDIVRVGYYYNTSVNGWSDFLVISLADKASVNSWWEVYHNTSQWAYLGNVTTPVHGTIALNNSNSPASKWFKAISQGTNGVVGSVYGKEMVSNVGVYDGDDGTFTQLTNGTDTDLNNNTVRTFVGHIPINGEVK